MNYILRRFGFYLAAFWVSITLNFFLPRLMPGDPVSRMVARLQGEIRPDQIEALRTSFGLSDAPLWEQYARYIGQIFYLKHPKKPMIVTTTINAKSTSGVG